MLGCTALVLCALLSSGFDAAALGASALALLSGWDVFCGAGGVVGAGDGPTLEVLLIGGVSFSFCRPASLAPQPGIKC